MGWDFFSFLETARRGNNPCRLVPLCRGWYRRILPQQLSGWVTELTRIEYLG